MYNKKWIIRDTDGNLPTEAELTQFLGWLRCETSCPIVVTKTAAEEDGQPLVAMQMEFHETDDRPTIQTVALAAQQYKGMNDQAERMIEEVREAAKLKDWKLIRRLLNLKEVK